MTDKSRRDILKYTGASIVGLSVTSQSAGAERNSQNSPRRGPGQHTLDGSISITNNDPSQHKVTVKVKRVTPGRKNPTIDTQVYAVPGLNAENNGSNPNIIEDDTPIQMSGPGIFEIYVETDTGESGSVRFSSPTGKIRSNEKISIQLIMDSVRVRKHQS